MKIGVLSDTHMMQKYIDKTIPYLSECELLIHAGDNFSDSKYIYQKTNIPVMAVRGNCDFDNVEDELLFEVEGKNIFLCHGDSYSVKYDLNILEKKAKEVKADIVIFGHTHIPLNVNKDNILYINPGSVSLPRSSTRRGFMIIDINNSNIDVIEINI